MSVGAEVIVREFWRLMASNDFHSVSAVLAPDLVVEWPQSGDQVVTQVSVADGTQSAEPISLFTVRDGRIVHLLEYWPDPFPAAANRSHLVERMS
jgi:hypothetical protein